MISTIWDLIKTTVFSALVTIAGGIFVLVMYLWPNSWFAMTVTVIVVGFALFMVIGIGLCFVYDLYQMYQKHHQN